MDPISESMASSLNSETAQEATGDVKNSTVSESEVVDNTTNRTETSIKETTDGHNGTDQLNIVNPKDIIQESIQQSDEPMENESVQDESMETLEVSTEQASTDNITMESIPEDNESPHVVITEITEIEQGHELEEEAVLPHEEAELQHEEAELQHEEAELQHEEIESNAEHVEETVEATADSASIEEVISGFEDEEVQEHIKQEMAEEQCKIKMDTSVEDDLQKQMYGESDTSDMADKSNISMEEEEVTVLNQYPQEPGTVMVVTTADANTKEIVLRTADGQELPEGTVTVQQVTDETGQVYLVETVNDVVIMEEEDNLEVLEMHKLKNIPSHVLGRNITNPAVDVFRNGKNPPKPRLGVKIPYRNLTSQIVSKQEITEEILERSKKHNKQGNRGQNLFAKKLTQTLAKKLAPNKKPTSSSKEKKLNNSDLLAILEGDDDAEPEPEVEQEPEPMVVVEMTKELEREIALKQLSEMPDDPPPPRPENQPTKTNKIQKAEVPKAPEQTPKVVEPVQDLTESVQEIPVIRKIKKLKSDEATEDDLPKNPRFASNVPLKTYTRKRKQSDELGNEKPSANSPTKADETTKKIDLPVNPNSYITKSSRIIKKKIIWDPDEVSPRKVLKIGETAVTKEKGTPSNKNDNSEKKVEKTIKVEKREVIKTEKRETPVKKVEKKNEKPEKRISSDDSKDSDTEKRERKPLRLKPKESEMKVANDKLVALRNKKRLTEVDKLLMDEGAVNMLYSFKKSDEDQAKKKPNKSLMSKTNELLNDLQTSSDKVSPKSLRKKEGTPTNFLKTKKIIPITGSPVSRQKSRDSIRSSLQSPPPSPGGSFPAEASRIIRRHSSSSFSSDNDVADDMDDVDYKEKHKTKRNEVRASRRKNDSISIESPRKKLKKDTKESNEESPKKRAEDTVAQLNKAVQNKTLEEFTVYDKYKSFNVKKYDQLMQICLIPNDDVDVFINIEMMQEICAVLKELATDAECNMVVLSSDGLSFCNGINYKMLVVPKEVSRKNIAKKLATNVRDFLYALADFPKVLVAAVHGDVLGLGVTMLPLFDMVIANDAATFTTPYASLGCIAEGGSLLSLPHLSQNVIASELLYSSRSLLSEDALRLGLITRILWPDKFNEELIVFCKKMANQSAQFMEATKKQLRHRLIPDIRSALSSETEILVQQWISAECQKNFSTEFCN